MRRLRILSLYPGSGGLDYAFVKEPKRFRHVLCFDHRDTAVWMCGGQQLGLPIIYGHPDEYLIKLFNRHTFDVVLGHCPLTFVTKAFFKAERFATERIHYFAWRDRINRILEMLDGCYFYIELPPASIEHFTNQEKYFTVINYASYGLPQNREAAVFTNIPLPKPQFAREAFPIHPELGITVPALSQQEWKYSKKNRVRANRVFGRALKLDDVRYLMGYPDDFHTPPPYGWFRNKTISLMCATTPPMFSPLVKDAILKAEFGSQS